METSLNKEPRKSTQQKSQKKSINQQQINHQQQTQLKEEIKALKKKLKELKQLQQEQYLKYMQHIDTIEKQTQVIRQQQGGIFDFFIHLFSVPRYPTLVTNENFEETRLCTESQLNEIKDLEDMLEQKRRTYDKIQLHDALMQIKILSHILEQQEFRIQSLEQDKHKIQNIHLDFTDNII